MSCANIRLPVILSIKIVWFCSSSYLIQLDKKGFRNHKKQSAVGLSQSSMSAWVQQFQLKQRCFSAVWNDQHKCKSRGLYEWAKLAFTYFLLLQYLSMYWSTESIVGLCQQQLVTSSLALLYPAGPFIKKDEKELIPDIQNWGIQLYINSFIQWKKTLYQSCMHTSPRVTALQLKYL